MGLIWPSMGIVLHTSCIWALDFPSDSYFGVGSISQLRREMTIDYETIITLDLKGKTVAFFLKQGVHFTLDNLVDVNVYEIPQGVTDKLPLSTKLVGKTDG